MGAKKNLLLVPNDRSQPKDFLGDSTNAHITVTIRGPPESGETSSCRVMDEPHSPAQLSQYFFIRLRSHKRVCPCVDGDVVPIGLNGLLERLGVLEHVLTNKEVGHMLVIVAEELVECARSLGETHQVLCDKSWNEKETNWQRTIVKAEPNHASGSIPNVTRSDALVCRGADSGAIGIKTGGIRWVLRIGARRRGYVWYLASCDSSIQRIEPCLGHIRGRGEVGGEARRPFYPAGVLILKSRNSKQSIPGVPMAA